MDRERAPVASALATLTGGAMDAWVYSALSHVFANAQSGNIVLMGVALAGGDVARAATHMPSFLAFVAGAFASRLSGESRKRNRLNSRNVRLGLECVMLVALGLFANRMADRAVTACVRLIAGVQITSLSHIGSWSFNTAMTTGNLRAGLSALAKALTGSAEEWPHAGTMLLVLCFTFGVAAAGGAWLTPRLGGATLVAVAALIAAAIAAGPRRLDRIPGWTDLKGQRQKASANSRGTASDRCSAVRWPSSSPSNRGDCRFPTLASRHDLPHHEKCHFSLTGAAPSQLQSSSQRSCSRCSLAVLPSNTTRPPRRTVARSTTARAGKTFCSIKTRPVFSNRLRCSRLCRTCVAHTGDRSAVGSSGKRA
jgi:uncharacterized membrane protein YoaK (UPF0700 family)